MRGAEYGRRSCRMLRHGDEAALDIPAGSAE
jgi:hypothetical protein